MFVLFPVFGFCSFVASGTAKKIKVSVEIPLRSVSSMLVSQVGLEAPSFRLSDFKAPKGDHLLFLGIRGYQHRDDQNGFAGFPSHPLYPSNAKPLTA